MSPELPDLDQFRRFYDLDTNLWPSLRPEVQQGLLEAALARMDDLTAALEEARGETARLEGLLERLSVDRLVNAAEAARMLGLSRQRVSQMLNKGEISYHQGDTGQRMIREIDVHVLRDQRASDAPQGRLGAAGEPPGPR